jgi:hypothetical protein
MLVQLPGTEIAADIGPFSSSRNQQETERCERNDFAYRPKTGTPELCDTATTWIRTGIFVTFHFYRSMESTALPIDAGAVML